MREYAVQEGVFEIPDDFVDKTINTFILGTPGSSTFNLSLARDNTFPDETIDAYVMRQLAILKKILKAINYCTSSLHDWAAKLTASKFMAAGRKVRKLFISARLLF